jgi:hypothetical protein
VEGREEVLLMAVLGSVAEVAAMQEAGLVAADAYCEKQLKLCA